MWGNCLLQAVIPAFVGMTAIGEQGEGLGKSYRPSFRPMIRHSA